MKRLYLTWALIVLIFFGIIQLFTYEEALPTSLYVPLDGKNFAFNEYGSGENSLIIIHGSPGSKESMEPLAKEINNTKVYAPDMFCFGESTKNLNDCGIEAAANSIKDFMESQDLEKSSLLGYSWGGGVVITFAEKYPKKVDKLILLSANGIQEGEPTGSFSLERIRSYMAYPFTVYYPGAFAGDYRWRRGFIKSFTDSDLRPIEEELRQIKTPTLILHGKQDSVIEPWVAEKHKSLLENSQLELFEGNHITVFKEPWKVSDKINEFLKNG